MWPLYALGAAVLTSFLPIINKRVLPDTDVAVVAWGFNALSLPILGAAAYALMPYSDVDTLFALGIVGSGFLNLIATLVSTQALKLGDASLVTPFLTFNPVFSLLISIVVLHEIPNSTGAFGVFIIVIGAYVFAVEKVKDGLFAPIKALLKQSGVVLAILAGFLWGLTPILEKIAIQHSKPENPPLVAFWTTLVMSFFLLLGIWWQRLEQLHQISRHKRGFLLAALIAGVAPLFGFTALAQGFVGYVTALFKLSPVFTVIFAYFILKEGAIRQRLLGSAVMVAGAILLAFS